MFNLNYEIYRTMGGQLSESDFNRERIRVECVIKNATHGRLDRMEKIPDEVYSLSVALIDRLNELRNPVTSRSQNSGGVNESESYAVPNSNEQSAEIAQMMYDYLSPLKDDNGIPLLYRGAL